MAPVRPASVAAYLEQLPPERREVVETLRAAIKKRLQKGFLEALNWGMICYEVPLEVYPDTYNGKPLMLAAIAAQKQHYMISLTVLYTEPENETWLREEYARAGKKLDLGKSCIRFKSLGDLWLEPIEALLKKTTLKAFLRGYEASRGKFKKG